MSRLQRFAHQCLWISSNPLLAMQEEEEERFIPASPKYDERSFFYTTPAAFRPAALAGRPQTQWATQGTFLSAAPAPAPAATSSQGNAGSFQPSQDSHKLQQQHQQEPQQRRGEGRDAQQQQQQQRLQEDTRYGAGGESPSKKRPRSGQAHVHQPAMHAAC